MNAVVFDLETTGLSSARGERVIEVGAIRIEQGIIRDEFHSLIDAGRRVSYHAQKVHGISDAMLNGHPRPETVWPAFHDFIAGALLVAHNASFDLGFLRHELGRCERRIANRHQCTLRLSRRHFPELTNHRLETVFRHLGGVLDASIRRHRALGDARMAAFVWRTLNGD